MNQNTLLLDSALQMERGSDEGLFEILDSIRAGAIAQAT